MSNPSPPPRRLAPRLLAIGPLAIGALGIGLAGCATHVRGSWGCALDPGMVCASISEIDHRPASSPRAANAAPGPAIDGAVAARMRDQAGWTVGAVAGAPIREPDPILKIVVAPWIDSVGDFHGAAEVFAVMRRGGWFLSPPPSTRRVDLGRTSLAVDGPTPPPTTPVRGRP
jgi:conjugal transfer pilus assembly protein TraV